MHKYLNAFARALTLILACCVSACTAPAKLAVAITTDPVKAQIVLPVPAQAQLPSLFFIGDSTVRNGRDDGQGKGAQGQWGWGHPIATYFDETKINVVNRAVGGLSSRTYLSSGHWQRTLALVKPGDVVLMQFGHNDNGAINDTSRARGSLKGSGEDTQEIDNLLTLQHEVVHSYGWYLRKYVADIKAKGATAIICSLVPRKNWDADGKITRAKNSYATWAEQVALQEQVGFIDLNDMVASHYDALGRAAVMQLFPQVTPDEHTHTNLAGAELNARQVMRGLTALKSPVLQGTLSTAGVALAGTASVKTVSLKPLGEDDRPVVDGSKAVDETVLNPRLPSLFIVGDSTVKSGGRNGAFGWGERITPYFDTSKINVVNHAIGGRSSRTFLTEGRWDKVLAQLKAGDFVLIQFGHNDGGRIGDPAMKNRASGAGIGPETVEDIKPDGSKELVNTFGWYMRKYVADAKLKGATVILVSPVPHKDKWENGRDFASFAEWGAAVAQASGAYYVDLTLLISEAYKKIGAEKVATLFADARTHTNDSGAQLNAGRVVFGLKSLKDAPFAAYFSAAAQSVSAQP